MNLAIGPAVQALANGISDAGMAGFYDNGNPDTAGADTAGRLIGNRFASLMSRLDRLLSVIILTDDDVEANNRVTLSRSYTPDEHGPMPSVFFDHRYRSARTMANREFLVRKSVELLRAAGARAVHWPNWAPAIFHTHSTMRMGLDAAASVCDE